MATATRTSSGRTALWEMNGTAVIGVVDLGNPGAAWHPVGAGGYFRAANADLPWQNDLPGTAFLENDNGDAFIWSINGAAIISGADLGNPSPDWHIRGAGDFDGDGHPTSSGKTTAVRPRSGKPTGSRQSLAPV
jgi:hypothetical protein